MKHTVINLLSETETKAYVLPLFKDEAIPSESVLFGALSKTAKDYIQKVSKEATISVGSFQKIVLPGDEAGVVVILGLGAREMYNRRKYVKAARALVQGMRGSHLVSAVIEPALLLPSGTELSESVSMLATNTEMANYEFVAHKEIPKDGWYFVQELVYLTDDTHKDTMSKAVEDGAVVGDFMSQARELSNMPGGDMTPTVLANSARSMAETVGVTCRIIGEAEMAMMGMGGILGVSKGSVQDAQLIVLEYNGAEKSQKPLAFLGKGITFDSGGLDLKPSGAMNEMHMDMTGAASVISAICAIARLGLKVNVVGVCPAVENMPSGQSYRPGDLLKSMSGKTIEIVSPDAEGRVVLADALTYTETHYDPALVVDLATLTGASIVALGSHAAAVLSPNEEFAKEVCNIGEKSGDYMWPLPMWEEYEGDVKGVFGDVANAERARRQAGTINGGMFLYQFAKSFTKWAHIDIAPTMTTVDGQFLSKGASGTGVRFLVELARSMSL
ncbi:MAG: leucyl aminopeptidase family protein [Patescibacteria group bacterium]